MTKAIASTVEKKVAEKLKAMEQEKASGEEAEAFIMSVVKKCSKGKDGGKALISYVTVDPAPS
jgi:hypothetical protein